MCVCLWVGLSCVWGLGGYWLMGLCVYAVVRVFVFVCVFVYLLVRFCVIVCDGVCCGFVGLFLFVC